MAVWNLGSINIDNLYRVPHLPRSGETIVASEYRRGLGGKGANMSVAIARAAARVVHIGCVGPDGGWARDRLLEYGVDTDHILVGNEPTGHANIVVDTQGENQIVIHPGANRTIGEDQIRAALGKARAGDTLVMQNETNAQLQASRLATSQGLRILYAAAPFDPSAVQEVLDSVDVLVLNEVEAEQLSTALGKRVDALDVQDVVVTKGAAGVVWFGPLGARNFPAVKVTPVDTTGAGDTFTGYLAAGLDRGFPMEQAISLATRAAAIMVTRVGTADVIPDLKDIEEAKLS